jgi:vancomycin resistance protein YoaR
VPVGARTDSFEYRTYGRPARRTGRRVVIVLLAFLATVSVALGAQAFLTRNTIVPGVSVAGVDVGGLEPAAARARLAAALGPKLTRSIAVETPIGTATVTAADAGISIDLDAAVAHAYATGRIDERLLPYAYSAAIDAPMVQAPDAKLPPSIRALARAGRNATVAFARSGTATVTPGEVGTSFDARQVLGAIYAAALSGAPSIHLDVVRTPPAVTDEAAQATAASATALLSAPFKLEIDGHAVATIAASRLAPLLRVDASAGTPALVLDTAGLRGVLAAAAHRVSRKPTSARFRTSGRTASIVPDRPGRTLDVPLTAAAIVAAGDAHVASIAVAEKAAPFTAADAAALGIHRALFRHPITTDMGSSSPARIWNVHLLARILDGHIIKAGATFDFNKIVGERTVARGFQVGQQIENGLLVPAVGGGVCQVATTLFDSAFYAGMRVSARINHAFYLSHYPMGMDATVSWGGPELRFTNTLKHAVLIRTSYTNQTLSIQMYGTPEGLTVKRSISAQTNFTSQKTRRVYDPTLRPGQEKTSGPGEGGFTVTVFRTVRRNGKVILHDSYRSVYIPEDIIVTYGPKKAKAKPPVVVPPAA